MGGSVKSPQTITLWWTVHKALYNLYGRKATFKIDFCINKIAKFQNTVMENRIKKCRSMLIFSYI